MDELKNTTGSIAYQQAHLPPEPELAAFIGLFLADQAAVLKRMEGRNQQTELPKSAEDACSTD